MSKGHIPVRKLPNCRIVVGAEMLFRRIKNIYSEILPNYVNLTIDDNDGPYTIDRRPSEFTRVHDDDRTQ